MIGADPIVYGLLFIVGVVVFVVFALYLALKIVAAVFRALFGWMTPRRRRTNTVSATARQRRPCPHDGCANWNRIDARYCGACGRPLTKSRNVDQYG